MVKAEVVSTLFHLVFSDKILHQEFKDSWGNPRSSDNEVLLLVEEDHLKAHFNRLNIHKNSIPDRMYPQILRSWSMPLWGHFKIIFEMSWHSGEIH